MLGPTLLLPFATSYDYAQAAGGIRLQQFEFFLTCDCLQDVSSAHAPHMQSDGGGEGLRENQGHGHTTVSRLTKRILVTIIVP